MTQRAPATRAVVLGGGILGVATAHQLSRRGATVTLVSDTALASGASGRSLAWLNSAAARSAE
jgi:glycine/D-amino acid oxidase-like deaminating enzyme